MSNFELPANVKQIGSIDDGLKIYVEDYVNTYLRQYAEAHGYSEKIAFLVGKYIVIDACSYIFISGVILGEHSEYVDNMEVFTEQSFDHAMDELERYYKDMEIVGWMQSQPSYGVYLNPAYADYHMNNFTRPYQVLFVTDPVDKQNMFYSWNEGMTGISEKQGYFVYYENNTPMREYMQDNRISRTNNMQAPLQNSEKSINIFKTDTEEPQPQKTRRTMSNIKTTIKKDKVQKTDKRDAKGGNQEKNMEEYRKVSNLLVGLCAVLFIVSFIMGAGLLQSDSRIAALENQLAGIGNNYIVLSDQIRQLASLPVFAEATNTQDVQEVLADMAEQLEPEPSQVLAEQQTQLAPTPPSEVTHIQDSEDEPEPEQAVAFNVPESYIIQPGDSLLQISRMFYGDIHMVERIMEINNIDDPDMVVVGQTILLPQH